MTLQLRLARLGGVFAPPPAPLRPSQIDEHSTLVDLATDGIKSGQYSTAALPIGFRPVQLAYRDTDRSVRILANSRRIAGRPRQLGLVVRH